MKIINHKPALFFKPDTSIWTDPYIQRNLLTAHLNLDSDAATRNWESIEKTVTFIQQHLPPNSRLLDLGCGPGLYAKLFGQYGHHVTGVDFNHLSIEYALNSMISGSFIHADYIKDFPDGQYDAITMIYCDMGTHADEERDLLLKNCYQSLNTGGKLIFDVFTEQIGNERKEGSHWDYFKNSGFWSEEEHLILQQLFHYPENKAFAHQYNLVTNDQTKYFLIWERYYSKAEIQIILENIGFKNIQIVDNLLENNNFTSSQEIFIVAEK